MTYKDEKYDTNSAHSCSRGEHDAIKVTFFSAIVVPENWVGLLLSQRATDCTRKYRPTVYIRQGHSSSCRGVTLTSPARNEWALYFDFW